MNLLINLDKNVISNFTYYKSIDQYKLPLNNLNLVIMQLIFFDICKSLLSKI